MCIVLVILNYSFNCFDGMFLNKSLSACMKLEVSATVVRSIIRQAIPRYCNLYNIWKR
jgi:hypothetical protein